jgi:F1F0 ATPase subunit 2
MTFSSSAVLVLAIAAVVGVVLGLIFYGGLYWTVSRGLVSKRPALWFLFSLLARVSIVIAGFYFVSSYPILGSSVALAPVLTQSTPPALQMERLISCLLAFTITGLIVRWLSRPSKQERLPQLSELPKSMGTSDLPVPSLEIPSAEVGHASDS